MVTQDGVLYFNRHFKILEQIEQPVQVFSSGNNLRLNLANRKPKIKYCIIARNNSLKVDNLSQSALQNLISDFLIEHRKFKHGQKI